LAVIVVADLVDRFEWGSNVCSCSWLFLPAHWPRLNAPVQPVPTAMAALVIDAGALQARKTASAPNPSVMEKRLLR
jgi:hypothetical protein